MHIMGRCCNPLRLRSACRSCQVRRKLRPMSSFVTHSSRLPFVILSNSSAARTRWEFYQASFFSRSLPWFNFVKTYSISNDLAHARMYCVIILRDRPEFGTVREYGESSRRTNRQNGGGGLGLAPIPGYWKRNFVSVERNFWAKRWRSLMRRHRF